MRISNITICKTEDYNKFDAMKRSAKPDGQNSRGLGLRNNGEKEFACTPVADS